MLFGPGGWLKQALTYNAGIDGLTQAFTFSDLAHHHLAIGSFLLLAGLAQRFGARTFGLIHHRRSDWVGGSVLAPLGLALSGLGCGGPKGAPQPWAKHIDRRSGPKVWVRPKARVVWVIGRRPEQDLYLSHSLMILPILSALDSLLGSRIPVLPYLSLDSPTLLAVFLHHQWISGLLFLGAWAHLGIFFSSFWWVRLAWLPKGAAWISDSFCFRFSAHKSAIISHLSWVCLWLGFHTLGLYAHNDAVLSLGQDSFQVCLEPVLAGFSSDLRSYPPPRTPRTVTQTIAGLGFHPAQMPCAGNNPEGCTQHYWFGTFVGHPSGFALAGPADLLLAHGLGLGLHTTSLIVLKGALNAPGTKLMLCKDQ